MSELRQLCVALGYFCLCAASCLVIALFIWGIVAVAFQIAKLS